ncbi:acetate/propionate family kinase [Gimesia algae]|uniref:Acetate kinase n=1 Tax=Gimesia algae TaxID=2527971 RepID=A0A517VKR9_9PLAN|nr:acetate/propionate family kinase [Gimesia algae]QDT93618.1 Acetate kinase [Gimesia algae]
MNDQAATESQHILCINAGSSSLKLALYELGDERERLLIDGTVEEISAAQGRLCLRVANRLEQVELERFPNHKLALDVLLKRFAEHNMAQPDAAGHLVVHGGSDYQDPVLITPTVLERIRKLTHLAPLHLPAKLAGIDALSARLPNLPQVACFDTAFHSRMPDVAKRLPLADSFWDEGVRRYGFHGLSYKYVLGELTDREIGRTIIAHLGNGVSLTAIRDGIPLDTTMGFTPTGGVMMGSRSGDLDPGVLVYLIREYGYDAIERLVNHEAGLQGVSGVTSNMENLLDSSQDLQCREAVELFVYQIHKAIGGLSAVLSGLDTLVFTGGIGEHAAPVRAMICEGLEHLGVRFDPACNRRHEHCISVANAECRVLVVPTNEHLMIARHTKSVLEQASQENRTQPKAEKI